MAARTTPCGIALKQEFNGNPKVSQFMDEAREVHIKMLKANVKR
jgi:hypothetical protein